MIWAANISGCNGAKRHRDTVGGVTLPAPPVYALYLCFILLSRYLRPRVPFGSWAVRWLWAAVLIITTADNARAIYN